jgi:hypothetical protein
MDIVKQIMDTPEGGTSRRLFTDQPLPDYGYFVGGMGDPLVFQSEYDMDDDSIRRYVLAGSSPFIGWWTDEEDGKVYLDGSEWFESEDEAARVSRTRKEIAFWDIANSRELRLVYVDEEL